MASLLAPNPNPTSAFGIQQPWQLQPQTAPMLPGGTPPATIQSALSTPARPGPVTAPPVAAASTAPAPAPPTQNQPSGLSALAPAISGLQAGQLGSQAYDTQSGIVSTLGAAASGAAAGALAGSVVPGVGTAVGALVGGGIGLVTGGLNAWMSVGKENKANRDRKKLLAEAKAEQKRRDDIARADAVDELAFERKKIEEQKRLAEWQQNRGLLADAAAQSKAQTDEYISRGYNT